MDKVTLGENTSFPSVPRLDKARHTGFSHRLKEAVEEVNHLQHASDRAMEQVMEGKLGIQEGMLAIGKADISLRLLLQIRNKVMDAYREISRMGF